jgi:hypothetical protein
MTWNCGMSTTGPIVVGRPARERWRMAAAWVALATAAIAALAVVYQFDPAATAWYPQCPLHWLWGLHCPGCGSLRATHKLLHGEIGRAIRLNALWTCAVPALGAWCVLRVASRGLRRPILAHPASAGWIYALLAVIVAFGVLRNLPWYPWSFLAPH